MVLRRRKPSVALRANDKIVSAAYVSDPSNAAATVQAQAAASSAASAAPACPYHALTGALSSIGVNLAPNSAASRPAASHEVPFPGPAPFSLDSMADVFKIFTSGLHVAMLDFSAKYGPVCRFANPAALNGATSWVFLNGPDNVAHIAGPNYTRCAAASPLAGRALQ